MLLKEGYDISIMTLGSKANNYFKINNQEFLNEMLSNIQKFEVENTNIAMEIMLKKFFTGEIHECRIYYNEFISSISHPVKCEVLLPIELPKISYDNLKTSEGSNVLEKVTKHYLSNKILKSLLESKAGEESSRMAAMDSATNNAVKIYNRLILQYNRTRQASITNEICEIISGSEAL
jgi:F-type H+-transporting ATPase subunit gamma